MGNSRVPVQPAKKTSLLRKILGFILFNPISDISIAKREVDLATPIFTKDYISGDPNLPEEIKHKRWVRMYILLSVCIILLIALFVIVELHIF